MKLTFCGANQNVTGSRHLLEVNGHQLLLDCGLVQGHRADATSMNQQPAFDPEQIEAVVLSHGHIDHCGELPLLQRRGFSGVVYATPPTVDIVPLMLRDSAHIQETDARTWNLRHGNHDRIEPLYSTADAEAIDAKLRAIDYGVPREILPGVTVTFLDAGHILGSAIVVLDLVEGDEHRRLVFSGDLGRRKLPILRDPQPFGDTDYLLLESTYGDRRHDDFEQVGEELTALIHEAVAKRGKILIPAFALERTQELIYLLHGLYDQGKIPSIPIYLDSPLATRLLEVFKQHAEVFDAETRSKFLDRHENPFSFAGLRISATGQDSKALDASREPMIIISASGMCESGRITHHLEVGLPNPDVTVLFVGYTAEGTLGRRIVDGHSPVKVLGGMVDVRARIVNLSAFSAHADWVEQLEYLQGQTVRRAVYLVHGEEGSGRALQAKLVEAGVAPHVEVSAFGTSIEL